MVSARSIRAGAAYVELTVKDGQLVRGLERARARLKAFSAGVSDLGRKLMAISAVGAAPLIAGAKTFADFDKQMAMVSTMLDKPEEHMQRFTEGIRKMSVRFGEDTGTLAKGLYDILSASVAPEHALTVLEATMRAARGGITDAATATQAIINVLNAFHIPASRAGEVADMLFTTVRRGVLTFEEMAQSVGAVTATAAAAGLSMDDMGAAIATMTRNGLKADMAVTALQNILKEFLNPSKQGAELAKKYGIELSTMGLKADGLLGIMRKLSALPPDVIAKMFSNIRGLRGIYALRGDVDGLAKDLEMMRNKAGATETAFGKMDRTLSASFAKLWQSLKLVSSAIGEAIAPTLQKWMGD
ncbi:MAG TPA: phage tail tape measure protein, partial [Vicinamibacterales bacterium]|nr:phage tail tape measure protein [Vicinamibacterales bacterium]